MKKNLMLLALTILPILCPAALFAEFIVDERQLTVMAVQERGRKKPMTTLMTESLLALTGSQRYKTQDGTSSTPYEVMLSLWLEPATWETKPLLLISNRPLLQKMGLPIDRKLFSYAEVANNGEFRSLLSEAQKKRARDAQADLTPLESEALQLGRRVELYESWTTGKIAAIIPHPTSPTGTWTPITNAGEYYGPEQIQKLSQQWSQFGDSFRKRNEGDFRVALSNLVTNLRELPAGGAEIYPKSKDLLFEYGYQKSHPFRKAWICYLAGLLALALTVKWQSKHGYKLGWFFILLGLAYQVYGFYCRIVISGRPPVTNMYETVIWVAFGTVFFSIILEAIYKCRYFLLAASPIAILSLILADTQPTILDSSIHPLVPVLRHNTWLIIHVLTITLSYAAFALALGLGHIVLGKSLARTLPAKNSVLFLYLYRALQIGVLLLATGTVLGGVWANYSWGRFWDWDPKETWALTALLCYLALLHGRLVGWWGGFGLGVGSVVCFQAVLMSWYGVNFLLGKGLHSYGFGTGGYPFAVAFVTLELLFVAIAVIKRKPVNIPQAS